MRTNLDREINNAIDADDFIKELYRNEEAYHFDNDARDIINSDGSPSFTICEAIKLNSLVDRMYELEGYDPHEIMLDLVNIKNLSAPYVEQYLRGRIVQANNADRVRTLYKLLEEEMS